MKMKKNVRLIQENLINVFDFLNTDSLLNDLGYDKNAFEKLIILCFEKMVIEPGSAELSDLGAWLNSFSKLSIDNRKDKVPTVPEAFFILSLKLLSFVLDQSKCPEFHDYLSRRRESLARKGFDDLVKSMKKVESAIDKKNNTKAKKTVKKKEQPPKKDAN